MPGPIEAAGALKNPTRFAALGMGARQMTGLVTQRSPYRDGAVPYLAAKFYGGSRFDTILDGLNREITQRLTDKRRPGSVQYNGNTFPPAQSFYSYKSLQLGAEAVRVIMDGADGAIYDATQGQKSALFTKSAGAGAARFLGVNNSLFFGDGVEEKKWMYNPPWRQSASIAPGTLINTGAEPGTVQMALGGITMSIVGVQVINAGLGADVVIYIDQTNIPEQFANLATTRITFSGLTTATYLNGTTQTVLTVPSTSLGILICRLTGGGAATPYASDTGSCTTGSGITGSSTPTFSTTPYAITADGGQQWKCYGSAVQGWGVVAPTTPLIVVPINGTRYWRPNTVLPIYYAIQDPSGNIQYAINGVSGAPTYQTGRSYPKWTSGAVGGVNLTIDGSIIWVNLNKAAVWAASTAFGNIAGNQAAAILDPNGNLQICFHNQGTSGTTQPTWNTTLNGTTTDGSITWMCAGPGVVFSTASYTWAYSLHGIDGTVSTASPTYTIQGPILGIAPTNDQTLTGTGLPPHPPAGGLLQFSFPPNYDTQVDQAYIWRTAQGGATLVLEDQIPADQFYYAFGFYYELGIPDTSNSGQAALNALIAAPVAHEADPPQVGFTAPVYYLGRIWGIGPGSFVYYSAGPDAVTGNGNTQFPPLNYIPFLGQPYYLAPIAVQGGGLLVFTSSGIWIVLGAGTASSPFYTVPYFASVNVLSYNAVTLFNQQFTVMESNGKVSNIAIEYPFNPATGYTEVGFPIGDQFLTTTTGGQNSTLFNPATAYVSWCLSNTADTGLYVADGVGHYFRMSIINPPESGLLWSPLGAIAGGCSAMQGVEVSPGVFRLLMGPSPGGTGPILQRDVTGTIFADNGTAYPSWDAKGVQLLCSTGQWAEVSHIAAKSMAVGARPVVSVLLNEIAPSIQRPYAVLDLNEKSNDPPRNRRSVSVFSDRYVLAQNGLESTGDALLLKFDYGSQTVGDELLDFAIYAAIHEEREEMAQK